MKTYILILSSVLWLTSCTDKTTNIQVPSSTPPQSVNTAIETNPADGVIALDPSIVEVTAVTTESATGITTRPRN
jgi:hypothetical protein